jgi:glucose/arabinose dehydrogenase
VFVAEKSGVIKVFDDLGDATPDVFADLRTQVYDHGDRGLLGLALDPEFPGDPYVYALYTYDHVLGDPEPAPRWGAPDTTGDFCPQAAEEEFESDDCLVSGRLVRLTASEGGAGNKAIEASGDAVQTQLAEGWCQQFSSHSVGALDFGPEGALYAGGGDGASFTGADYGQWGNPPNPCGDPADYGGSLRSQNTGNLGGTIIRIDPNSGAAWPGNPLDGVGGADARIVAYGFRNPFRFTTDPDSGEMYVGNVGSSEIEEIDRFAAPPVEAFNSGWPCYEGLERQFLFKDLEQPVCESLYAQGPEGFSQPLFHYSHAEEVVAGDECPFQAGSAISGMDFYEGSEFPARYEGALFFSDSVRGCVYAMLSGDGGRPDPASVELFMRDASIYPGVEVKQGPDGALYYATLFGDEQYGDGGIRRITYAPGAPTARLSATPQWGEAVPLPVELDAGASSDPQGGALTYEWELDEDEEFDEGGGATRSLELSEDRNYEVAVRVEDGEGLTSVARLTLYPGDEPPTVEVTKPEPSDSWGVGDEIGFEGEAGDFEGGYLGGKSYRWTMRLAHCPTGPENCHKHPLQTVSGSTFGDFTAPDHDYPSYIEVTAQVTDERGLTASDTVTIQPRTVGLQIASSPAGIPLTAGLVSQAAPFTLTAIEDSKVVLAAPQSAQLGGAEYVFDSWSDGGERVHSVIASAPGEYEARYAEVPGPPAPPAPSSPDDEARDVAPPTTSIRSHPPKRTRKRVARFGFASSEAGSTYRCSLDRRRFRRCAARQAFRRLKPGRHELRVYAVDAAGNRDRTPARFVWRVLRAKAR